MKDLSPLLIIALILLGLWSISRATRPDCQPGYRPIAIHGTWTCQTGFKD